MQRFSVHDDFQAVYRRDGYVVLSDLFTAEEVIDTRQEIVDLFEKRFAALGARDTNANDVLTRHYDADKDSWRQCAKRMHDLLGPLRLGVKPVVTNALMQAGIRSPIMGTHPEVRTDMPADQRYMQPWHQDWRSGQGSVNSVTIWVPLQDVNAANGAIELLPASHFLGCCETEELEDPRRFLVVDPRIEDWEGVVADLDVGEAVMFSQLLVHRSGYNSTNDPRITIQLRYSDYSEPGFAAMGYPTPAGSQLIWNPPPSSSDVEAALVG